MHRVSKKIVLEPRELNNGKHTIQNKIRASLENTLIGEGFVTNVHSIVSISNGIVQHSPACAVEYDVEVDVEIFDIHVGDVIPMTINNVNGMGIFGTYKHATLFVPLHEVSHIDDTDTILHTVGDMCQVKIIGKRITDSILCIGTERFEDPLRQ